MLRNYGSVRIRVNNIASLQKTKNERCILSLVLYTPCYCHIHRSTLRQVVYTSLNRKGKTAFKDIFTSTVSTSGLCQHRDKIFLTYWRVGSIKSLDLHHNPKSVVWLLFSLLQKQRTGHAKVLPANLALAFVNRLWRTSVTEWMWTNGTTSNATVITWE